MLGGVALPMCSVWSDGSHTLSQSSGQCRAAFSVPGPPCQMQLQSVAINCLRSGHHLFFLLLFMQHSSTVVVHHSSKSFYSYLYVGSFITIGKALNHFGSFFSKKKINQHLSEHYVHKMKKNLSVKCV